MGFRSSESEWKMYCMSARAKIRRLCRYSHTGLTAVDCSLHFGIRDASLSPGFKTLRSAILEDDRLLGVFCEDI